MKTLAVDFDGTIHPYTDGWQGHEVMDESPTPGCREFLQDAVRAGFRIVIFSHRASHPGGKASIVKWLKTNELLYLIDDVTDVKPAAVAYVDDRGVPFKGDWKAAMDGVKELERAEKKDR